MLTKYVITVIDTVSTRDGSHSYTADKAYFEKISSYNGYLHASSTITTTFDSQEAAENFIEELPVMSITTNMSMVLKLSSIPTQITVDGQICTHMKLCVLFHQRQLRSAQWIRSWTKTGSLRSLLVALLVTAQTKALRSGFTNQTLSTP